MKIIRTPSINDATWKNLSSVKDDRGILTSIESNQDIPFNINRIFYMHHVKAERGGHAHTDTDQLLIAISGSFDVELFDGVKKIVYRLDDPVNGLYVPRMIFVRLFEFSENAVCLVLASTKYDMKKSLRNVDDYLKAIKAIND
jgi:hypothetical protein